jgi:hypothetical protein
MSGRYEKLLIFNELQQETGFDPKKERVIQINKSPGKLDGFIKFYVRDLAKLFALRN